jgi:hypothetical protein
VWKKRPCSICRRWFQPDRRVGSRQRACNRAECQADRRRGTQANWRRRNPEYYHERRLQERAERARAADEAASNPKKAKGVEPPRRPEPLRLGGVLRAVPWAFAQDEIGVQTTDLIAAVAKVLLKAAQDQRAA